VARVSDGENFLLRCFLLINAWPSKIPFVDQYKKWTSTAIMFEGLDYECRTPVYFSLEEHYCCDPRQVVPIDDEKNGMKNAWLPAGLQASATIVSSLPCETVKVPFPLQGSMAFSDPNGTFKTVYHTYHHEQFLQADVVDVIITGKVRSKPKFLDHLLLIIFCFVSG